MSGANPPPIRLTDTVVGGGNQRPSRPGRRLPVSSHQMADPTTKGPISSPAQTMVTILASAEMRGERNTSRRPILHA
jgi:hypothetical protein